MVLRNLIAVFVFAITVPSFAYAEDDRISVDLPADVREQFMAEMREHMATLDDIMLAIGDGDFTDAADIADIKLDFGHRKWEQMADQGMSPAQIIEIKKAMQSAGMAGGQQKGMGQGVGRYMPEEFREMGRSFHLAGRELAKVLRSLAMPPKEQDYRRVFVALADVTTSCRGCHDVYRVK